MNIQKFKQEKKQRENQLIEEVKITTSPDME
jgi:hypothetical protein